MKRSTILIILGILLIVTVNMVFGDMNDEANLLYWLPCEDNLTDMSSYHHTLAEAGTVGFIDGQVGRACDYDDAYLWDAVGEPIDQNNFTLMAWVMKDAGSGNDGLIVHSEYVTNQIYIRYDWTPDEIDYGVWDGSGGKLIDTGYDIGTSSFYYIVLRRWGVYTNISIFNSECVMTFSEQSTDTETRDVSGSNESWTFGALTATTNAWEGYVDEQRVYDRLLSDDEVYMGCTNNITESGGASGTTPSCTIHTNMTQWMNLSFSTDPFGDIPFHIVFDTNVNNSYVYNTTLSWDGVYKNYGGIDYSPAGTYDFDIRMTGYANVTDYFFVNVTNENASCVANVSYVVFDFINPTVEENIDNMTEYVITDDNMSQDVLWSFNFSDSNLDGFHLELWDIDNNQMIKYNHQEGLTSTFENWNRSLNFDNMTSYMDEGDLNTTFRWNYTVWDSHNDITKLVRYLPQDFGSDYIKVDGDIMFYGDEIKFGEEYTFFYLSENKYKMKITFEEDSLWHQFYMNGSDIRYISDSQYKGHFVSVLLKRYIDFEGDNVKSVDVLQFDDEYLIQIELYEKSDEIELESMGDLNVVNKIEFFYISWQETESLSAIYLAEISAKLSITNNYLSNISEASMMLWFTVLYIGLMVIGFWSASTGNYWFGLPILMTTTGMTLYYIVYWLYSYWYLSFMFVGLLVALGLGMFEIKTVKNKTRFVLTKNYKR